MSRTQLLFITLFLLILSSCECREPVSVEGENGEVFWRPYEIYFTPPEKWRADDLDASMVFAIPPDEDESWIYLEIVDKSDFDSVGELIEELDKGLASLFSGDLVKVPEKTIPILDREGTAFYFRQEKHPEVGWFSYAVDLDDYILHVWWQFGLEDHSFEENSDFFEKFISSLHKD